MDEGIWKCVGSSGTVFSEVEFTDGEWIDYDVKASRKRLWCVRSDTSDMTGSAACEYIRRRK